MDKIMIVIAVMLELSSLINTKEMLGYLNKTYNSKSLGAVTTALLIYLLYLGYAIWTGFGLFTPEVWWFVGLIWLTIIFKSILKPLTVTKLRIDAILSLILLGGIIYNRYHL